MTKFICLFLGLIVSLTVGDGFSTASCSRSQRKRNAAPLRANTLVKDMSPPEIITKKVSSLGPTEKVSLCIIGGGVAGLTAAITAAAEADGSKIVVLEASDRVGGRVQSDTTEDGFILDRGFAVFLEKYPLSQELLDYDKLRLGNFLAGALVKIPGSEKLVRVSDPLRKPSDIVIALFAPIGTVKDKINLLPLIVNVRRKSIEALFEEPETDTLTALKERWGFSDEILNKFFRPFFEGIFLAPLEQQSSRMFSFVFKMLSEGSATLPYGGMAAVSEQLEEKALQKGVEVKFGQAVSGLNPHEGGGYIVETSDGSTRLVADTIVVATDVGVAQKLLSQLPGLELKEVASKIPQRCVGCLYYSFEGVAPVTDPILVLNGEGESRGAFKTPINNVCFPSSVHSNFAPPGSGLCSVAILSDAIDAYKGKEDELDTAVREQLGSWFPDFRKDIRDEWVTKALYIIPNAQPYQNGEHPANRHKGRDCDVFRGEQLPSNIFLCGDHMATSSLNGALQSGVNAGVASGRALSVKR